SLHVGRGDDKRSAEAGFAREQVISRQAQAVEGTVEPRVTREDERKIVDEVRGVPSQSAALAERFEHESDMPLAQVADAAVDQLVAGAGRAAAEVAAFDEQDVVPASRGINGNARPGRPAADDDQVPRVPSISSTAEEVGPVHGD